MATCLIKQFMCRVVDFDAVEKWKRVVMRMFFISTSSKNPTSPVMSTLSVITIQTMLPVLLFERVMPCRPLEYALRRAARLRVPRDFGSLASRLSLSTRLMRPSVALFARAKKESDTPVTMRLRNCFVAAWSSEFAEMSASLKTTVGSKGQIMERRSLSTSHAAWLQCLLVFSVAAVLQWGTVILADEPQASEVTPIPTGLSELLGEFVAVEPDDVAAEPSQPAVTEPAHPTPAEENPPQPERSSAAAQELWRDRPIGNLKATLQHPKGDLPPNNAAPRIAETTLMGDTFGDIRPWVLSNCEWESPATRHLPLLFEEPNLERMGDSPHYQDIIFEEQSRPRITEFMQPLVSGAHFAGNLVMIPYRCGYQPLTEPFYTLGVDRPGSPVYSREHQMPIILP